MAEWVTVRVMVAVVSEDLRVYGQHFIKGAALLNVVRTAIAARGVSKAGCVES